MATTTLFMLLLVMASSLSAANSACHPDDLKGLLDFKAGVHVTSGRMNNWTGVDCCSWNMIKCSNSTGRVISIVIEGNYDGGDFIGYDTMNGTISESIGKLSSLERLALENLADLSGPIPVSLGKLVNLKFIFLNKNSLTGSIPSSLGALSRLEQFYVNENKLTGSIPKQLGSLKNLQVMNLEINQLTGNIPASFGGLSSLQQLVLSKNKLVGPVPASLGYLSKLTNILLSENRLSGSIPPEFGNLTSLEELDLSNNALNGYLPASLGVIRPLKLITLSNNFLSGNIPASWGSFINLTSMDLTSNQLSGSIPKSFSSLQSLSSLTLGHNKLSGEVPDLSKCTQLDSLDLSYNQFRLGNIPTWLKSLGGIGGSYFRLSLASCGINSIPRFLSDFNMGLLDLSMNNINLQGGNIPDFPKAYWGLYHLNLSFNPLNVELSSHLSRYTTLDKLDLHSARVWGSLSTLFSSNLSNLNYMDLSNNYLSGGIPSPVQGQVGESRVYINLSRNNLGGSIPKDISNLVALETLDLSHNRLESRIPRSIGNMTSLEILDLSYNKLTGGIPKEVLQLEALKKLNLSSNMLSGKIPSGQKFPASAFSNNPALCGAPLPACK